MNNFKKRYLRLLFLIVIFLWCTEIKSKEIKIIVKIENDIITNIDIENEYNYLISLNKQFQSIDKEKILGFAKESLIKEVIKKNEILKYYELNKKNEMIDVMIENIYRNLEINSKDDFINYLGERNLDLDDIYKKIEIEAVWNQMIYAKFQDKIILNEEKLKKKIEDNPETIEIFLLKELIYDFKNQKEIEIKYKKIIESIKSIGFDETVIKFSIAESKNNFGSLGWINKNVLSNKIKNEIEKLEIGEISKPMIVPSGILILKIVDKKIDKKKIDLEFELNKAIQFETNSQLNNYSTLYFNKIKNNLAINEY